MVALFNNFTAAPVLKTDLPKKDLKDVNLIYKHLEVTGLFHTHFSKPSEVSQCSLQGRKFYLPQVSLESRRLSLEEAELNFRKLSNEVESLLITPSERRRRVRKNFTSKVIRAAAKFKVVERLQRASIENKISDSTEVQRRYIPPVLLDKGKRIPAPVSSEYDLSIRDGLLHLNGSELPYTTDSQAEETIIGMDRCLTVRVMPNGSYGSRRVYHSTLFSAANLRFAGTVKVDRGYIEFIDNDSGHYQPTEKDLFGFARILAYLGVDLSKAILIIRDEFGEEVRRVEAIREIGNSPEVLQRIEACQAVIKKRRILPLPSFYETQEAEAQLKEAEGNVALARESFEAAKRQIERANSINHIELNLLSS